MREPGGFGPACVLNASIAAKGGTGGRKKVYRYQYVNKQLWSWE